MRCPKCGNETKTLYAEQRYSALIPVELNTEKEIEFADFTAGYNDIEEWIDSMLEKDGPPIIHGCPHCL